LSARFDSTVHGGYGGNMSISGLEGVVAASTRLSHVDGERGELVIGGYHLEELAERATFEETTWLLWHGELPSAADLEEFRRGLADVRRIPDSTLALLRDCAQRRVEVMEALRMAAGTLSLVSDDATGIVARVPTIVASYWRLRRGEEPLDPRSELGHSANFLYMLSGRVLDSERVRGLETYLNTVIDHGLNASTFTARVITSTGSDLVSAVTGALGALKGPLHGGAPGPALEMVFEIGEASRAEAVLRKKIESGEKLMGFGHRVYKVRDPRADVLARAAERLFTRSGDMSLYTLARAVEAEALRLLEEYKPGRRLQTNVEFYTALLLHGLGFEVELFTPTFAISRVSGWIAHSFEQRRANRIIRPQSEYEGPRDRKWVPLSERVERAAT
jgi:citrate synthase